MKEVLNRLLEVDFTLLPLTEWILPVPSPTRWRRVWVGDSWSGTLKVSVKLTWSSKVYASTSAKAPDLYLLTTFPEDGGTCLKLY